MVNLADLVGRQIQLVCGAFGRGKTFGAMIVLMIIVGLFMEYVGNKRALKRHERPNEKDLKNLI